MPRTPNPHAIIGISVHRTAADEPVVALTRMDGQTVVWPIAPEALDRIREQMRGLGAAVGPVFPCTYCGRPNGLGQVGLCVQCEGVRIDPLAGTRARNAELEQLIRDYDARAAAEASTAATEVAARERSRPGIRICYECRGSGRVHGLGCTACRGMGVRVLCPNCSGSGFLGLRNESCAHCNHGGLLRPLTCTECGGTRLNHEGHACTSCHGRGARTVTRAPVQCPACVGSGNGRIINPHEPAPQCEFCRGIGFVQADDVEHVRRVNALTARLTSASIAMGESFKPFVEPVPFVKLDPPPKKNRWSRLLGKQ